MSEVLVVAFDRVYGAVVCRPVCDRAKMVAQIAGTKTLLPRTLKTAQELGFKVELAPGSKEFLDAFVAGAAP